MKLRELVEGKKIKIDRLSIKKHGHRGRLILPTATDASSVVIDNKYGVKQLKNWIRDMKSKFRIKKVTVHDGRVDIDNPKFNAVKQQYVKGKASDLKKWGTNK